MGIYGGIEILLVLFIFYEILGENEILVISLRRSNNVFFCFV